MSGQNYRIIPKSWKGTANRRQPGFTNEWLPRTFQNSSFLLMYFFFLLPLPVKDFIGCWVFYSFFFSGHVLHCLVTSFLRFRCKLESVRMPHGAFLLRRKARWHSPEPKSCGGMPSVKGSASPTARVGRVHSRLVRLSSFLGTPLV